MIQVFTLESVLTLTGVQWPVVEAGDLELAARAASVYAEGLRDSQVSADNAARTIFDQNVSQDMDAFGVHWAKASEGHLNDLITSFEASSLLLWGLAQMITEAKAQGTAILRWLEEEIKAAILNSAFLLKPLIRQEDFAELPQVEMAAVRLHQLFDRMSQEVSKYLLEASRGLAESEQAGIQVASLLSPAAGAAAGLPGSSKIRGLG